MAPAGDSDKPKNEVDTTGDTFPPPASSVDVDALTVLPAAPRADVGKLVVRDLRRGAATAVVAAAAVALAEYVISLLVAQGSVRFVTLGRFLALDVTLLAVALLFLVPLTAFGFAAPRLLFAATGSERARTYAGVGAETRVAGAPFQPIVPWLWALLLAAAIYVGASYGLTSLFMRKFKEPHLIAAVLATIQLGLIAVLVAFVLLAAAGLRRVGVALSGRLGPLNPLGRLAAAGGLVAIVLIAALAVLVKLMPVFADAVPWRILLAIVVYLVGCGVGVRYLARSGGLWPRAPMRRRRTQLAIGAAAIIIIPMTLVFWGADPEAKFLAVTASPPLSRLVDFVRFLNDFDRDGYGSLLGENDCAPFNADIHPNARDIPDNGIDENCNGRDFSTKDLPSYKAGTHMPVPDAYKRDWNFLLVTIDATRVDHTGFGGYKKKKGRDTTPNLDVLAARSIQFNFANAPSAGTMASVPAIVISKFFHSGIALGPERRPDPPKVLPENTLISEVMKRGGYATGAILSHEYFNDWGLEQGFDLYDNSLGAKVDPNRIVSQDVTAKAQAFIAKQGQKKWFLWTHYIDPHGKYMAHPDFDFGPTEEDLYDGEIAYTDKYLGKLLDYVAHSPAANRTVIVVTSDHGDGFMEHGQINHGMDLYFELLRVPLLVYIPEAEPHVVEGPVSGLDIFPTLADLAGIDINDLTIEGESLVPQIFYGKDAKQRVVFAETNFPVPLRAAISDRYKLIYNLKNNVYELYDLVKDGGEKRNLWSSEKVEGAKMKSVLDEWLDRVYYSRDPHSQAQMVRSAEYLLTKPPAPQHATQTEVGDVKVEGWDVAPGPLAAGKEVTVTVYLTLARPTAQNYRMELELFAQPQSGPRLAARQERTPAGDGVFPTSKWKLGEHVKETFKLRIPPQSPAEMSLGVRFLDSARAPSKTPDGQTQAVVGTVPIEQPK